MNISTKGRYGLRLMVELGLNYGGGHLPTKQISKKQNISEKYLEQIIGILSKAGLIKTKRGASGGHALSKEPENYTIGEILRVLEGSLTPVQCVEDAAFCDNTISCVTYSVWKKLDEAIKDVVDNITLKELVDKAQNKDFYACNI